MSYGSMLTLAGTGIGIVAVGNVAEKRDPFPALLAGGMFTVVLAVIREGDDDIAVALAGLFLASVLLRKGRPFFQWASDLVTPAPPETTGQVGG